MLTESRSRTELVDQALEGQSAEVKARVLAIILRYNIDVRNEFFLIFVAIGHLLAIVEESPENWRSLFDDFKGELDEWTDANLRTLEAIQQQGAATERMSQSFLKLTDSILNSNGKTEVLQNDLITLSKSLSGLSDGLRAVTRAAQDSGSEMAALKLRLAHNEQLLRQINKRGEWTWNFSVFGIPPMVVAVYLMAFLWWQQSSVLAGQGRDLDWLVNMAVREDCWRGLRDPNGEVCQQVRWEEF